MLTDQIVASISVLFVSTFASMVGIGGGTLYVPLLLVLGFPFHQAVGISLFTIVVTSLSATLSYRHTAKVDWKLALWIEPPTFVMAFIGGYLSGTIGAGVLKGVLVVVLLFSSYLLLRPVRRLGYRPSSGRRGVLRHLDGRDYRVNLGALIPATGLAGLLAGMEGISGGVLKVPTMVLLGGVPVDIAVATSEFMVSITATTGLLGHLLSSRLDLAFALPLAVAASVGGQVGARLTSRVSQGGLKRLLAGALLLAAVQILWGAFAPGA